MILYLMKVIDEEYFDLGVTDDVEALIGNTNFDLNASCYYKGEDSDLKDLSEVIHQLFKKYINEDGFFENSCISKIIEFIEYQANNYGFIISEKMSFEKSIINNSEKLHKNKFRILSCFVYNEQNISIGLKNSLSDKEFRDEFIDKDKSIVIYFQCNKVAKNFFTAIYLLTKSINKRIDSKNFTISSESVKQIQGLIINQIRTLAGIVEYKLISLSDKKVFDFGMKKNFTSDEVCKLLGVDRQKLAYWRKTKKIKFKKISDKKFIYQRSHVYNLLENMMIENEIKEKDMVKQKDFNKSNLTKVNKRLEKLKTTKLEMEKLKYEDLIIDWIKSFTYKIADHKYNRQKFFLNFGNVGISSSPQVMINDNFQLVDFIKRRVIKSTPQETWEYIEMLKNENISPRIDSSKSYYDGYKRFYLNNLRD